MQILCDKPCLVAQFSKNEASPGDMYQAWAQMGDTMTVLTPLHRSNVCHSGAHNRTATGQTKCGCVIRTG